MTLDYLNACSRDAFVAALGFAFEGSPWVAGAAAGGRPYADLDALHARMVAAVEAAGPEAQLALIRSHPDLAGRLAREGRLTTASTAEQTAAGLDRLTPEEIARFDAGNRAYRERFGFPFVICAREHTKASIFAALEARRAGAREAEIATALREIAKIARLRLAGAVA